jgi:sirohydrochlorin cobaltochelatase
MTQAIILFAHGARDPRWSQPFEAVAEHLGTLRPGTEVRLAYLEFMAPTLLEAAEDLARGGCTDVSVVPMFLGAGGHVRRDLPQLVEALQLRHPQVQWRLKPAIGEAPSVIQAMAREAAGLVPVP